MTAGVTIWNDWGTVQVDDTWATMSLRYKQQITIQAATSTTLSYEGSLTVTCDSPMVCWQSDQPIALYATTVNGSAWTFTFRCRNPTFATIFVFDRPIFLPQNSGLEIFDGAGNKVFGDQLSPMKIAAVVPVGPMSVTEINLYSNPFVWDGLPAGNYAVCVSDIGVGSQLTYVGVDAEFSHELYGGAQQRTQGGRCDFVPIESIPGDASPGSFVPPRFLLIIDVTGL